MVNQAWKQSCLVVVVLMCLSWDFFPASALLANEPASQQSFRKITLTREFYSEGAHFGDINQDGQMDIVAGPFWYAGPDFTGRHEFMPAQAHDPNGYSANFVAFTHDLNSDGWTDIIIVGFPGEATNWYENPQGKPGHWPRHVAVDITDNESPTFGDVTGDGKPELVFHTAQRLGYAEPNWDQPTQPWKFHPVSAVGGWQKYTHGFGFGDVNNDGRTDLMLREGWWEQPSPDAAKPWKHHAVNFGDGGAQMYTYDVDGDGDNDVITSLQAHGYGLAWFESQPQPDGQIKFERHLIVGSSPAENPYGVKFSQLHAVDLVDINGDGLKDIVTGKRFWAHGPKGDVEPNAPAVLYWFELRRDGGKVEFTPHLVDDDSGVGTQVVAGDVSGDGLPDIVVGNKKGAFVFVQEKKD